MEHLIQRGAAALFLDPGLGKTSIVLEAFRQLKEAGQAERMLVVAPLRVTQLVWQQEGRKWSQFRDFTFSLLHGPKKADRLRDDVDIHLINPEGIAWLSDQFYGHSDLPWDTVVIDELTKFKNPRVARSKKLRKRLTNVRRRWGLTGSPAPNGYMDLFGQMLILDDGASLGRFISYFRDQYFTKGFDGFSYELQRGADRRIEERIAPYVLRMAASDYLELPPLIEHVIEIDLPSAARRQYEEMKKEMLLALPEGVVSAANSAAVYSKLKQMANGAVYIREGEYVEIHDAKLDALDELIEELAGQPLLVAYEFQHDLDRLRDRLGRDVPTLSGLSHARITEVEAAWNRGELPVLLAHPASAGHGLNLQGAGASHVCWFSRPWDLELYDQFIRRIYRQGSTAAHVVNHALVVRDSMDEIVGEALGGKDTTQQRLLMALNAEIMRDGPATTPVRAQREGDDMAVRKLGFKGESGAAPAAPAAERPASIRPAGWGAPAAAPQEEEAPAAQKQRTAPAAAPVKRPAGWGAPGWDASDPQREAIQQKIRAPEPEPAPVEEDEDEQSPASVRALSMFGPGVVEELTGEDAEDEAALQQEFKGNEWSDPVKPIAPEDVSKGGEAIGWDGLSTRYANALRVAGYESPEAAHSEGQRKLVADVAGFGQKGWDELEALFGGAQNGQDEAPQPQSAPRPAGWSTATNATGAAPSAALATSRFEMVEKDVPAKADTAYHPAFDGASAETLATLFESIARLLRGA